MRTNSIFDIAGGIVFIGIITAIVSGKNTASVITSGGNAFSSSIRAALGK